MTRPIQVKPADSESRGGTNIFYATVLHVTSAFGYFSLFCISGFALILFSHLISVFLMDVQSIHFN